MKMVLQYIPSSLKIQAKRGFYYFLCGYFSFRHWYLYWFYVLNRTRGKLYKQCMPELGAIESRIAKDLKEKGIAVSSFDELFPGENMLGILRDYTENLRRSQAGAESAHKEFLYYLWDEIPELEVKNPFTAFIFSKSVIGSIAGYFDFFPIFYGLTLNITRIVPKGASPQQSQRWHRDPEDKKICKVFIYLTDVDEGAGPFTYVIYSNYGGKYRKYFPQRPPAGLYPQEGGVEKVVEGKDIKVCTGRAGTVVFADTTGFHKGGYATSRERIMFTGDFVSAASPWPTRYRYSDAFASAISRLSPNSQHALSRGAPRFSSRLFKIYKTTLREVRV